MRWYFVQIFHIYCLNIFSMILMNQAIIIIKHLKKNLILFLNCFQVFLSFCRRTTPVQRFGPSLLRTHFDFCFINAVIVEELALCNFGVK